nr:helix-turn-helix domain-containing protein [Micromonospora sp. DSM 115978]
VVTRMSDPRHTAAVAERAARTGVARAERLKELAFLEAEADELSAKTARWGVKRVDAAMEPILARVEELNAELAALDEPGEVVSLAADVAAAWDDAERDGDLETIRAMVRRTFPRLTLRPSRRHGDNSPERFDWDATGTPADLPPDPAQTLREALVVDGGATVAELCAATGMSSSWTYARLSALERAGEVVKTEKPGGGVGDGMIPGRYQLASSKDSATPSPVQRGTSQRGSGGADNGQI